MKAEELGVEHVGQRVSFAPAGEVLLLAVEQGGPFEVPEGIPTPPYTEGGRIPPAFTVQLLVRRGSAEPFYAWLVPYSPVTVLS